MNYYRIITVLSLTAVISLSTSAGNIRNDEYRELSGRSQVVLRWSTDAAYTSYEIIRCESSDGTTPLLNTAETLVSGYEHTSYIDHGVLPGRYVYIIYGYTDSTRGDDNGWHDGSMWRYAEVSVSNRDFGKQLYSLGKVYETTTRELMDEWGSMPNISDNDSKATADTQEIGAVGGITLGKFLHVARRENAAGSTNWLTLPNHDNSSVTSITGHYNPRPSWRQLTEDEYFSPTVKNNGQADDWTNNGQVLDGNRYIWLDQIEEFDPYNENSAEYFPWAGRGLSWRGSDISGSTVKKGERCWYINMRNTRSGQYGVLQVWDTDLSVSSRPYQGAPLYLDPKLTMGAMTWTSGGTQHSNLSYGDVDNAYSLAFSENGRSYISRTGLTQYDATPSEGSSKSTGYKATNGETFLMQSVYISGNCHRFKAEAGNWITGGGTWWIVDKYAAVTVQKHNMPGSPCNLLSVKGNLNFSSEPLDAKAPKATDQNYAYLYRVPTYGANTTRDNVLIRRDYIQDFKDQGYIRLSIKGLAGYGGIPQATGQNYVIPMAGKDRSDFILQLHNNYMVYVYNDQVSGLRLYHQNPNNATTGAGASNAVNADITRHVKIDPGATYNAIVGGCTFEHNGEIFLVLPHARPDGSNHGDFTIYRVLDRDTDFKLEPVYEYYCRKDGLNAGSSARRTFVTAEVYDTYANILTYLPGRMIAKYRFDFPPEETITPSPSYTFNYEPLPESRSYRNKAHINNGVNNSYTRVNALNAHINWNTGSYRQFTSWNGLDAYNTPWMIEGYRFSAYHANNAGTSNHGGYWEIANRNGYYKNGAANTFELLNNGTLGLNHELSAHVMPVLIRKNNGFIERVIGHSGYANTYVNYNEANPTVRVKVFKGTLQSDGHYRVDLDFDPPATVYASNGQVIPVDHYNIYRQISGTGDWIPVKQFNTLIGDYNSYFDDKARARGQQPDDPRRAHWNNINYISGQDVIYGDYNFDQWRARVARPAGQIEPNADNAVLSFYSTDPSVANSKYIVQPVYCDAATTQSELRKTGYGEAWPIDGGITGIGIIAGDGDKDDIDQWYTLQGVRVNPMSLTPGLYLHRTSRGTQKVLVE